VVVGRRLSATRTASHGVSRHSGDTDPKDQDGYGFPPDPLAFRRPSGVRPTDLEARPKPCSGPPCAFAPLQRHAPAAPHRGVAAPTRRPGDRPAMLPFLGFGALRHIPRPVDPLIRGGGSLRHRVPRARFGYLLRGLHHRPSRRAKRRSVHGLRPPRRSPRHERCPSRGPCPPDVAGRHTPRGERSGLGRLQGLVPASSPCCHRIPEGTRPSMPS
jgi:hypothetical protein